MSQYDWREPFGHTSDADHWHLTEMAKKADKFQREQNKGGGGGCMLLFCLLAGGAITGVQSIVQLFS